jgi:hypothetical protein
LQARLHADPEWVKQKAERDAYWAEVSERYKQEEAELVAELNAAGLQVKSVSNLGSKNNASPAAIPILFRHLQKPYLENTRAMIARALAIPEAAYLHDELVSAMRQRIAEDEAVGKGPKTTRYLVQQLAVAVAETTTEDNILALVDLAQDESLGDDRLLFLRRLKRSKNPSVTALLAKLATDPVFSKEIASWRRKPTRKG